MCAEAIPSLFIDPPRLPHGTARPPPTHPGGTLLSALLALVRVWRLQCDPLKTAKIFRLEYLPVGPWIVTLGSYGFVFEIAFCEVRP